ncbi:hypothetical protein FDECE_4117 [Fusarium decemcellulare]|nr:hypothetical protein FDECE_4117 [Fusarium decemcellulare]
MEASASYPRHLAAPFNLQDPNLDILQGAPLSFLEATFPGVNSVTEGRNRSYINFHLRDLPRRPWPLTIGGVPITLSTRAIGRGTLFPDCHSTWHYPRPVCEEFDGRYRALSDNDLRRITRQLEPLIYNASYGISITEVVFASVGVVYVILKLDLLNSILVWGRLPSSIAKCPAVYLYDHDIEEALSCANGETQYSIPAPSGTYVTRSGPVSPGAIIHSPHGSSSDQVVAHTTVGVLIKDGAGKQFVATSINPKNTHEVYQTLPIGPPRYLGTAVAQVPFTYVTLVKPQSSVKVTNEVQIAGYKGRLTGLLDEQATDRVAWHDRIHIVSPFANNLDGVVEAKSVRPEYDLTQKGSMDKCGIVGYTVHHWAYMGQVEDVGDGVQAPMPAKGALGAAVVRLRCNSVAVGLFRRYYRKGPFAGFGVYLSASELVKAGYQLA